MTANSCPDFSTRLNKNEVEAVKINLYKYHQALFSYVYTKLQQKLEAHYIFKNECDHN